ncbi:MAG: GNAT family N-acetyltransferase [Rhizobiales bacterium 65-9]|nr:GNAT family N-acetyltransferase [Hyphomicrobiales bacterium]OJY33215.1 MAG: GNAT family N-acetyltransferase [Rhizobiales bacterium 65-9]
MTITLRPYLPSDAKALIDIFLSSVEELTADDYSEEQREAWMSAAADEDAFVKRVTQNLTLIATVDGEPAAFASLKDNEHVEFLYVHPGSVGQGLATHLFDALEKLARNRGAKKMTVDASDTALPFFEHRGFVMKQRNSVHRAGEWLANTSMEKTLTAEAPERRPQ